MIPWMDLAQCHIILDAAGPAVASLGSASCTLIIENVFSMEVLRKLKYLFNHLNAVGGRSEYGVSS